MYGKKLINLLFDTLFFVFFHFYHVQYLVFPKCLKLYSELITWYNMSSGLLYWFMISEILS